LKLWGDLFLPSVIAIFLIIFAWIGTYLIDFLPGLWVNVLLVLALISGIWPLSLGCVFIDGIKIARMILDSIGWWNISKYLVPIVFIITILVTIKRGISKTGKKKIRHVTEFKYTANARPTDVRQRNVVNPPRRRNTSNPTVRSGSTT